jgi:hypothetical protein
VDTQDTHTQKWQNGGIGGIVRICEKTGATIKGYGEKEGVEKWRKGEKRGVGLALSFISLT